MGEDDHGVPGIASVQHSIKRLHTLGKNNYELLTYPGAGHLIDMPYVPVITETAWGYTGDIEYLKSMFFFQN